MLRKARKVIPREACIILYDAMILPLFDYCCAVWGGCAKTNRDYLDKLQRRAASIIEGVKSSIKISTQLSAGRPCKIAENITLVFKSSNVYTNLRLLIFFIISAILLTSTPIN